jgi:hypothetical protein
MAMSLGAAKKKIAEIGEKAKRLSASKNLEVHDLAMVVAELCDAVGQALQRVKEE